MVESRAHDRGRRRATFSGAFMTRGLRTLVVVLLALSSATHARAATEADPARCKASYEGAQVAMQQERFGGARAELVTCQQLCPAPLARDCTRWLAEVDATAPTVRL